MTGWFILEIMRAALELTVDRRQFIERLSLSALGFSLLLPEMIRAAMTAGVQTQKATGQLAPGEYYWEPAVSPSGPVTIVISLPQQELSAYRNGIQIARSSVSSGAKGRQTPTGVFTILQKNEKHYSSIYKNASMPYMQRLTWQGIALHGGNLPGYPASHGCVRLPVEFAKRLYTLTALGATVIIADAKSPQATFGTNPGMLMAPKDFKPEMLRPLASGEYQWAPDRSPTGPVAVLVSAADKAAYVYRNGNPIGRAAVDIVDPTHPIGGHVFTLLEGYTDQASSWVPGKKGRKWMEVKTDAAGTKITPADLSKRISVSKEFAGKVYDLVEAGTVFIFTDDSALPKGVTNKDFVVLSDADQEKK